jgi:hypothetical protein
LCARAIPELNEKSPLTSTARVGQLPAARVTAFVRRRRVPAPLQRIPIAPALT